MNWPDYPLLFYPVMAFAVLITGISKGGFAAGAGSAAVPLMSIFIAPPEAAGIMLPILCAMDIFGIHAYWGRWSRAHLSALVPGAVIGIFTGGILFGLMPVNGIRLLIGLIALVFALNQWLRLGERLARRLSAHRAPPGRLAGTFWGGLSGMTSTLAHAGGPPFAVYMLPQKLDKTALVGTSVAFFLVVNYVKLIPYHFLGQLSAGNFLVSLAYAPLAPLGIWLGVWLHRRISEQAFYRVSYILLFITGAKLVWDSLGR